MTTPIVVGHPFHSAEAYHQKWRLRQHSALFGELLSQYESEPKLLASTAAAKLNAYVSGHWEHDRMDLDTLGLSPQARAYMRRIAQPQTNPITFGRPSP